MFYKIAVNTPVIVRSQMSGVLFGLFIDGQGQDVILANARRIHSWSTGARTCNEIANHGVGAESNVSEPAEKVVVFGIFEILVCTKASAENLTGAKWSGR